MPGEARCSVVTLVLAAAAVPVRVEVLAGVLHHVLHGVLPPVADPAEELQTLGQPPRLHPGPVAREVVQHHRQVREQNVETAELAVDPSIEQHKVRNSS